MCATLQFQFANSAGKLNTRDYSVGSVTGNRKSHLLFIFENNTKRKFLIDCGADSSVYPVSNKNEVKEEGSHLVAANGTKIPTYGEKLLDVNLGMRRKFVWPFIIADVKYPILGADFLSNFNLSISLYNKSVLDENTGIVYKVDCVKAPQQTVCSATQGPHTEILN